MKPVALLAVVAAVLGTCIGCGTSGGGVDGDCSLRIRLDGASYSATALPQLSQDLVRHPFPSDTKVKATEVDCDGSTVDRIEVQQIQGVALTDAVYVDDGSGGLTPYFNTTLQSAPVAFRSATLPVHCDRAVTFTGRLESIGDQDYGSGDLTPPYTAELLVSDGTGLPLQEWAALDIDVKITSEVPALPTRDEVDKAINDRSAIAISAHCDGTAFVADTFALAS